MDLTQEEIDILINLLDQVQFTRKDIPIIEPLYQKLTMQKLKLTNISEPKKEDTP